MKIKFKYRLAVFLLNLISKTWKYEISGSKPDKPGIVAFWHGSMLPVWKYFGSKNSAALVSKSKDGEILAHLLKKWRFTLVRGSSRDSGKEALRKIVDLPAEKFVLITPDGPRGPAKTFKPGAAVAALRRESPLYLCGVRISSYREFLKSWDSFKLPLPFSKIKLNFSNGFFIDSTSSRDKIEELIEEAEVELNKLDSKSLTIQ